MDLLCLIISGLVSKRAKIGLQRRGEKRGKTGLKLVVVLGAFYPQTGESSVHEEPGINKVPAERWQQGLFFFFKELFPGHKACAAFLLSKNFFSSELLSGVNTN